MKKGLSVFSIVAIAGATLIGVNAPADAQYKPVPKPTYTKPQPQFKLECPDGWKVQGNAKQYSCTYQVEVPNCSFGLDRQGEPVGKTKRMYGKTMFVATYHCGYN